MLKHKRLWLVMAIVIMGILVGVSITTYRSILLESKERVLNDNLFEIRRVIKQYIADKHQAPHRLQDLVDAGYFRELPIDPMTNSNSTWKPVIGTVPVAPGQSDRGITDLRSGSSSISSKGTAYAAW